MSFLKAFSLLCDLPELSFSQPLPNSLPVNCPCCARLRWGFLKHSFSPCPSLLLLSVEFLPRQVMVFPHRDHALHSYFCISPVFLCSHIHSFLFCVLLLLFVFFFLTVLCPQHLPRLLYIWRNIITLFLSDPEWKHILCAFVLCAYTFFFSLLFASQEVLGWFTHFWEVSTAPSLSVAGRCNYWQMKCVVSRKVAAGSVIPILKLNKTAKKMMLKELSAKRDPP